MAERMERIVFERIDAVQTTRLIAINAYNRAAISDVRFGQCHALRLDGGLKPTFVIAIQAPSLENGFRPIFARPR